MSNIKYPANFTFLRYLPFVRRINRSPVDSPDKGKWRGASMLSLICASTHGWANNRDAGDLKRHGTHYDFTVMACGWPLFHIGLLFDIPLRLSSKTPKWPKVFGVQLWLAWRDTFRSYSTFPDSPRRVFHTQHTVILLAYMHHRKHCITRSLLTKIYIRNGQPTAQLWTRNAGGSQGI